MDPSAFGNLSENVQQICEELVASNTDVLDIETYTFSDDDWRAIAEALKRNKTLQRLGIIDEGSDGHGYSRLSVSAASSLALGIVSHPSLEVLIFCNTRFAEFSAILMAITQNPKLATLGMFGCCFTTGVAESLAVLLREDALESLQLCQNFDEDGNDFAFDLKDAFSRNQSLKGLWIYNGEGQGASITENTLKDISQMLEVNDRINSLNLDCEVDHPSHAIPSFLRKVKGHSSLKQLCLMHGEMNDEGKEAIASLLTVPSALERLDLTNCDIGNEGIIKLARGLKNDNCHLKALSLIDTGFDETYVPLLADALHQCSSIEEIQIRHSPLCDKGVHAIISLISSNKNIQVLVLIDNNIGPKETIVIANALSTNSTLEKLHLQGNPIGDEGARALLDALKHNTSLNCLEFGRFPGDDDDGDNKSDDDDDEDNKNYPADAFKAQADLLTALNEGGRQVLGAHDVPRALWPHILAKSSDKPDVIYYFLQQKPDLLKKQSLLGKRKRDSSSCTIS